MKIKTWLVRFQEFAGWAPLAGLVVIAAWVALGGIADRDDLIRRLLELPVAATYALLASGIAYLVWRRWSYRMCDDELAVYWNDVLQGRRGAVIVFLTNAVFYLCVFMSTLFFLYFWR